MEVDELQTEMRLAASQVNSEWSTKTREEFYTESRSYLLKQCAFFMTQVVIDWLVPIREFLSKHNDITTILEYGCHIGMFSYLLSKESKNVFTMADNDGVRFELAKRWVSAVTPITINELKNQQFDLVISLDYAEHTEYPILTLEDIIFHTKKYIILTNGFGLVRRTYRHNRDYQFLDKLLPNFLAKYGFEVTEHPVKQRKICIGVRQC